MNQDNTKPGPEGMKGSWRDRLGISKELPKIAEEFKEVPEKPQTSERDDSDRPTNPPRPGAAIAKPAPMAPRPGAAELGDRLRQQREAAERMAEQRVAEAKDRAVGGERRPPAGQPIKPAGPVPKSSASQPLARPRFTFAEEELRSARAEPPVPRAEPGRPRAVGQPAPPAPRPVFTAERQANQNDPRLRTPPPLPRPSSAPPLHTRSQSVSGRIPPAPQTERQWQQPRPQRAGPQQGYDPYRRNTAAARALDEPLGREEPNRQQQHADLNRSRAQFRGAHSRELGYVEDESDDLFEDEQTYSPQTRRRATAQDYTQAYREFEGEAVERRRTGPILILAALIAMGAIFAGIFLYRNNSASQTAAPPNVPVVAEPSEPVKTDPPSGPTAEDSAPAPQDEQQSMAPVPDAQTPVQKKQIYDRILGETTLEEQEQVLPSEEQPVPPAGQSQGFEADPLPLPMPPPPGDDQSRTLEPPAPGQTTASLSEPASQERLQQPSPASANLDPPAVGGPDADDPVDRSMASPDTTPPAAAAQVSAPAEAVEGETPVPPAASQAEKAPQLSDAQPQPKPKTTTAEQRIDSELAFAEQPSSASGSGGAAGPIQIAPLTGGAEALPGQAVFAPVSPALPDLAEGSSASTKRRTVGARATDRPASNPNRNFNKARQGQLAQVAQIEPIEAEPIATQTIAPQTTLTQPDPQPATAPEPAIAPSAPSQQASIAPALPPEPQPTHGTDTIFTIQLASYKSEADALAGYEQLRQQHGQIVGSLRPSVQKADLGANGTFYRLHLGSFSSKQAAKSACTSLLAAGERDCIVKSR